MVNQYICLTQRGGGGTIKFVSTDQQGRFMQGAGIHDMARSDKWSIGNL